MKLINNSRGKYKRNTYLINICKSDTDFASDLYLIYNRSPAARVCKSDTDRLLMLYLVHIYIYFIIIFFICWHLTRLNNSCRVLWMEIIEWKFYMHLLDLTRNSREKCNYSSLA